MKNDRGETILQERKVWPHQKMKASNRTLEEEEVIHRYKNKKKYNDLQIIS